LQVPKLEQDIGIEVYATSAAGIGGVIRESVEGFVVEEILVDGSKAETSPSEGSVDRQVLGSSQVRSPHLLCVLVKRNWDTLMAVRNVAERLGVGVNCVHFAGLKDAKAITAQHVTIDEASVEDVRKVNLTDIDLRPVGYLRRPLSSYFLLGNSFRVTISQIGHDKATIRKHISETIGQLGDLGGAPNFYGHQRFGTSRPITHLVGKALVKGDFEKAAMLFLAQPFPDEHPESRHARERLRKTRDFRKASEEFPRQLRYERAMLRRLVEKPDDFVGAFRMLPARLRRLFPQAFQSYLFNKSLSKRIVDGLPLNRAEAGDYVVGVEHSGLPAAGMFKVTTTENLSETNNAMQAGKMRLALPLVGYKRHPSKGAQGNIVWKILEAETVKPEDFKISALPEASSKGELRTAITPINGLALEEASAYVNDPSKHKTTLSFMLLRGSYATAVLREMMKPQNLIQAGF